MVILLIRSFYSRHNCTGTQIRKTYIYISVHRLKISSLASSLPLNPPPPQKKKKGGRGSPLSSRTNEFNCFLSWRYNFALSVFMLEYCFSSSVSDSSSISFIYFFSMILGWVKKIINFDTGYLLKLLKYRTLLGYPKSF